MVTRGHRPRDPLLVQPQRRADVRRVGREDGEWISVRFGGHAYPFPIMDGFAYHPYCGWETATTDRIYAALDQLQLPGGTPRLW